MHLTEDDIQNLKHPLPLTKLEQEWLNIHDQYGHISFREMDRLVENIMIPSKFKNLKGKHFMCPSCAYEKMRKSAWQSKGITNLKHNCQKANNKPGAKIFTDQIVVAQPGLVPQLSGRHMRDRICGATCVVDHFSKYSYSVLQTSLDGEQILNSKTKKLSLIQLLVVSKLHLTGLIIKDLQKRVSRMQCNRHSRQSTFAQ